MKEISRQLTQTIVKTKDKSENLDKFNAMDTIDHKPSDGTIVEVQLNLPQLPPTRIRYKIPQVSSCKLL